MLLWQKGLVYVFTCGKLVWEYPFEYHYAICCCLFAVTLIQGTFYPALLPFGWLFLVVKHFVDKFVLLFGHNAEQISTSGQALRDEESELSNRQEMSTVSTFLGGKHAHTHAHAHTHTHTHPLPPAPTTT